MWNKLFAPLLVLFLFLSIVSAAHAVDPAYNLAVPIPGSAESSVGAEDAAGNSDIVGDYIRMLFPFTLSIAAALAFIMIVVGGIQYIAAAGNPSLVSDAKSRIWAAVGGLLLAAMSVIILRTINPKLTEIDLQLSKRYQEFVPDE